MPGETAPPNRHSRVGSFRGTGFGSSPEEPLGFQERRISVQLLRPVRREKPATNAAFARLAMRGHAMREDAEAKWACGTRDWGGGKTQLGKSGTRGIGTGTPLRKNGLFG